MRFVIRKLAVTGAFALSGVAAAQQTPDTSRTLPPPPIMDTAARPTGALRQGDILNLKVYRDSELSGSYLIDARGDVQIPGLGTIRAAGLAPAQVTDRM